MLLFFGLFFGVALVCLAVWIVATIWSSIIWPVVDTIVQVVLGVCLGGALLWQESRQRKQSAVPAGATSSSYESSGDDEDDWSQAINGELVTAYSSYPTHHQSRTYSHRRAGRSRGRRTH